MKHCKKKPGRIKSNDLPWASISKTFLEEMIVWKWLLFISFSSDYFCVPTQSQINITTLFYMLAITQVKPATFEKQKKMVAIPTDQSQDSRQTFTNAYMMQSLTPKEKAMAPHSSPLAWRIPWMEEPGRLQSMGLLRVGHD